MIALLLAAAPHNVQYQVKCKEIRCGPNGVLVDNACIYACVPFGDSHFDLVELAFKWENECFHTEPAMRVTMIPPTWNESACGKRKKQK